MVAQEQVTRQGKPKRVRHRSWLRVLLLGFLLYLVGIVVLVLTGNPNLFPTVVMVGNFLVLVTFVSFFYERREWSQLSMATMALGGPRLAHARRHR